MEENMSKGDKWKRLFINKGWLKDDVINGGEGETLRIAIPKPDGRVVGELITIDSALHMPDEDVLCYEDGPSSVIFQWDDIVQVRIEHGGKKKKWL
jgi:hypothetical protein